MTCCLSFLSFRIESLSGERFQGSVTDPRWKKSQLQEGDGWPPCSLSKEGADSCWRSADILATEAAQVAIHLKTLGNIAIFLVYLNPHESNL